MNNVFAKLNSCIRYMRYLESMGIANAMFFVWRKVVPQKSQMSNYLSMFAGVGLEIGGPSSFFNSNSGISIYEVSNIFNKVTFGTGTKWEVDIQAGALYNFSNKKATGIKNICEAREKDVM